MKQIIENLQSAIDTKSSIVHKYLNRQEPYYYAVQVERTEKKSHLGGALKKMTHYKTTTYYETEIRFNQGLFEKDIADASARIELCEKQMILNTPQLEQDLTITSNQRKQAEDNFNALKNQKLELEQDIKFTEEQILNLEKQLTPLRKEDCELEKNINNLNLEIEKLDHVEELTNNPISEIDYVIQTFDVNKRAMMLLNLWDLDDEVSLEMLEAIKHYGFDAHYQDSSGKTLLKKAASLSDLKLLELVLIRSKTSVEENTLLDYALENSNNEFIVSLLEVEADFSYATKYIVTKDKLTSFQRLSGIKPELIDNSVVELILGSEDSNIRQELSSQTKSFSQILNYAIDNNNNSIVEQLITLNKQVITSETLDKFYLEKILEVLQSANNSELNLLAVEHKIESIPQLLLTTNSIEYNPNVNIMGGDVEGNKSEDENGFTEFDNF